MNTRCSKSSVLVTGGAGYLGSVLVPKLLQRGHRVDVADCFLFGVEPLVEVENHPRLVMHSVDVRDHEAVTSILKERRFDSVIHLAAMSNDPSAEIDAELTRAVNLDAVDHVMRSAKANGVNRFVYASSARVYGIKEDEQVTEDLSLEPLTLYARYKVEGERILNSLLDDSFCGVSVRAATVCGWSPRMRLDLTINILTEHALTRGRIRVFGGTQMRPNVHIQDLTDLYALLLETPREKIQGEAFNVSFSNASVGDLAEMVRREVDPKVDIDVVPTDDLRSYRLNAGKVGDRLGWAPTTSLERAVHELREAFADGRMEDASSPRYRNVEWVKVNDGFRAGPHAPG